MSISLTKRFGLYLGLLILLLFFINIGEIIINKSTINENLDQFILLVVGIILIATHKRPLGMYIQAISISITSLYSLYSDPMSAYWFLQFFLLIILLREYSFFKNHRMSKLLVMGLILMIVFLVSFFSENIPFVKLFPIIIFFIIFITGYIIIKYERIKAYLITEQQHKDEIKKLKETSTDLTEDLDPLKAGLSNAEVNLLKKLCLYKESNRELALKLDRSVHTIKSQFKSIFEKTGVGSRYQLIDLYEKYFKQENQEH